MSKPVQKLKVMICLEPATAKAAKAKAKSLGLSFSAFIEQLIRKFNNLGTILK